jgi:hypothetical protein
VILFLLSYLIGVNGKTQTTNESKMIIKNKYFTLMCGRDASFSDNRLYLSFWFWPRKAKSYQHHYRVGLYVYIVNYTPQFTLITHPAWADDPHVVQELRRTQQRLVQLSTNRNHQREKNHD